MRPDNHGEPDRTRRMFEALSDAARVAVIGGNALQIIADGVRKISHADWVTAVFVHMEPWGMEEPISSPQEKLRSVVRDKRGHTWWVVKNRENVEIDDVYAYKDKSNPHYEAIRQAYENIPINDNTFIERYTSILCLPLIPREGGEAIGAMWFHFKELLHFSQQRQLVADLKHFANLAAAFYIQHSLTTLWQNAGVHLTKLTVFSPDEPSEAKTWQSLTKAIRDTLDSENVRLFVASAENPGQYLFFTNDTYDDGLFQDKKVQQSQVGQLELITYEELPKLVKEFLEQEDLFIESNGTPGWDELKSRSSFLQKNDVNSVIILPLHSIDHPRLGVLFVNYTTGRVMPKSPDEDLAIDAFRSQITSFAENVHSYHREQRHRRRLKGFLDVSNALVEGDWEQRPVKEALAEIARMTRDKARMDAASIMIVIYSKDQPAWFDVAGDPPEAKAPDYFETQVRAREEFNNYILRKQGDSSILIPNVDTYRQNPTYENPGTGQRIKLSKNLDPRWHALIGVPIKDSRGATRGALWLNYTEPREGEHAVNEDELDALKTYANFIATTYYNMRSSRRRKQALDLLNRIIEKLGFNFAAGPQSGTRQQNSDDLILEEVREAAKNLFCRDNSHPCSAYIVHVGSNELIFSRKINDPEFYEWLKISQLAHEARMNTDQEVRVSLQADDGAHGVCVRVARTQESILIKAGEAPYIPLFPDFEAASMIAAPISIPGGNKAQQNPASSEIIAVLAVEMAESHAFDEEDRRTLVTLAIHCANVIESHRIQHSLRRLVELSMESAYRSHTISGTRSVYDEEKRQIERIFHELDTPALKDDWMKGGRLDRLETTIDRLMNNAEIAFRLPDLPRLGSEENWDISLREWLAAFKPEVAQGTILGRDIHLNDQITLDIHRAWLEVVLKYLLANAKHVLREAHRSTEPVELMARLHEDPAKPLVVIQIVNRYGTMPKAFEPYLYRQVIPDHVYRQVYPSGAGRGTGLYQVSLILQVYGGSITHQNLTPEGVAILVSLPYRLKNA